MRRARTTLRSITIATVAVLGVVGVVWTDVAWAQFNEAFYQSDSNVSRKIMRLETERTRMQVGRYGTDNALGQKFSMAPLPGDQSYADSMEDASSIKAGGTPFKPDFGANEKKSVSLVFPTLKGLTQILDSQMTKDLLKRLTATKVPVMMQTYMMVENGAANGFMGGMNIGSNLLSNTMETQDLQLKLMDITDETGKLKQAYVAKVAQELQGGQNRDVWPAALFAASGEDGQQPTETLNTLTGTTAFDLSGLASATGAFAAAGGGKTVLLSDLLFSQNGGGGDSAYKNDQLDNLKTDFKIMVGDIEIKLEDGASKLARDVTYTLKAPAADSDQLRGVASVNKEEVQVVWENINLILSQYCTWKQKDAAVSAVGGGAVGGSGGSADNLFALESAATAPDIGQQTAGALGNPFELASAPDMPMTINVIEQLFQLVLKNNQVINPTGASAFNCAELALKAADMPSAAEATDNNFNDCGKKKGCLKNRTILNLSYMIGRSRTLHQYRTLHSIVRRFATDPLMAELLERVFARAFAGMSLDEEIRDNRSRYLDFLDYMARLRQGDSGAGANLRPGQGSNNRSGGPI